MTRVFGDPRAFSSDMIAGFAHAYGRYVSRVPGAAGFVRAGGPVAGKVSVLVGGGSGHYPSYAGIVGAGFADACVLGDIFTSPSSDQITAVGRAADGGAGLVLAFGNYAGDRLNFAIAAERLASVGIDSRTVSVTDDVASAAEAESDRRRGIAGTFTIYKVGGAAADRGDDLDTVGHLMRRANERTRSFGVAFAGCVLPGQTAPLFTIDIGTMETGLGIHGEPGIGSSPLLPAPELAALLVDAVLAERPHDAQPRAAVLLNGLGATKYEELFLLYGWVHDLLALAGVEPVLPEVGELVTSLDMAGCSLSITWLDDELEECWSAPAETAAFRRGPSTGRGVPAESVRATPGDITANAAPPSSAESRAVAEVIRRMLAAMLDAAVEHETELGRLDAVAGDGDHGTGMVRGLTAAVVAAAPVAPFGACFSVSSPTCSATTLRLVVQRSPVRCEPASMRFNGSVGPRSATRRWSMPFCRSATPSRHGSETGPGPGPPKLGRPRPTSRWRPPVRPNHSGLAWAVRAHWPSAVSPLPIRERCRWDYC